MTQLTMENKITRNSTFTNNDILKIIEYYNQGYSCVKIGVIFNVSKTTINKKLKDLGLLRKGTSCGLKYQLSKDIKEKIKNLYLNENKSPFEISKVLKFSKSFLEKHIKTEGYIRTKSESITLRQTGKKRTSKVCNILKLAQIKLAKSGLRKQTGGVCKKYLINGIECTGTYEKFFIELLIKENKILPTNSKSINTPYGVYYPDFSNNTSYIEIKSSYTYDVLIGKKINRWTNKIDTNQLEKIKWVNKNILPVDIFIVDKRKNKLIKKEIE